MRSTLGMSQYQKPPFEPEALYIPARAMKWGSSEHGYITIEPASEAAPATMEPLDLEAMKPPCDQRLAERLYRTGFLAMLLSEDGQPKMRKTEELKTPEQPSEPEPTLQSTCPRCGKGFKAKTVPYFHIKHCKA